MSVPFDAVAITSIARSGQVATALVASTAAITTGYLARIYGLDQEEYNGTFILTVVDATHFSFVVTGSPTTPATGSGYYQLAASPYIPIMDGPYDPPPTSYHSLVLEDSAQIKAGPGSLMSFYGTNVSADAAGCWIMLFDSLTLPANGTAPKVTAIAVAAEDNYFLDVPESGIRFTTGIYAAASTTGGTLTVKTDDQTHFDAAFHD